MKNIIFTFLFLFALVFTFSSSEAAVSIRAASFVPNKVIFDGQELNLLRDPLVGIIRGGEDNVHHYMPVKGVLEQMGYIVNYDDAHNIVTVTTPGTEPPPHVPSVSSTSTFASGGIRAAEFNNHTLIINGTEVDLRDEKMIYVLRGTEAHPTLFLPVRPILEYLGYFVGWDSRQNAVIVASDSFYSNYGVLKATEPTRPAEIITPVEIEEGVTPHPETVDDEANATEALPSSDMSPEEVTIISLDATVANAINILTQGLQDPSSLIFHTVRYSGDEITGYTIYIDFSSRNALGGQVQRIAEIRMNGDLVVIGETQIEDAADNTGYYASVRMAFQRAMLYREYGG